MPHIRVINPVPEGVGISTEEDIARLKAPAGPGTNVSVRYIKSGKPFIEGDYEDAYAVPGTVEAAVDAERDGANAVVINCTADTGYEACRECVSIPVVASTQAAMHLSVQLAHRFSVLTFSVRTIPRFERMAWKFGFWNRLASVRSVELPLEGMDHQDERLLEDLFRQGQRCVVEDGAHSLIMGCTAFELVSSALQEKFRQEGIPVLILEPYLIALKTAETFALMGISHSKLSYPFPKNSGL